MLCPLSLLWEVLGPLQLQLVQLQHATGVVAIVCQQSLPGQNHHYTQVCLEQSTLGMLARAFTCCLTGLVCSRLETPDSIHPWSSFVQEKHLWVMFCRIYEAAGGLLQHVLGLPRIMPQKRITRELSALVISPPPPSAHLCNGCRELVEIGSYMKFICPQFLLPT